MKVDKNFYFCFIFFICMTIFSYFYYGDGKVGEFLVTPYDEYRYLLATYSLSVDIKNYGLLSTLDNYYYYSQSVHFLHYYVLAIIRLISNDSMFIWSMYQIFIYTVGVYYFSKYISLEYDFIDYTKVKYISIMMFFYPVLLYLTFSLMRDISIFSFFSMSLYFYKSKKIKLLILSLLILSFYRINMTLCVVLYIAAQQMKSVDLIKLIKYFLYFLILIFLIDLVTFGFLLNNFKRISSFNLINFFSELLSLLFSPLPFSIDARLPEYLRGWFKFSFFSSTIIFLVGTIFLVVKKRIVPNLSVILFILFYVFTYSTEAGVGFRQAAIVLPFIYIPLVFFVISEVSKKLR